MRGHAIALALFLVSRLPAPTYSQKGMVDLSGKWKLNMTKSTWPPNAPKPNSLEYSIKQSGDRVFLEIITNDLANKLEYTMDGKPSTAGNIPGEKTEVVARSRWEGRDLVINSETKEVRRREWTTRFSLSGDGKTLTVKRSGDVPDAIFVFDKQ